MSTLPIFQPGFILELASKDPRTALTAEGMTSSREEPIVNLSTQNRESYTTYIKSVQWKQKKNEWVNSGRPTFCFACEEPMPRSMAGFNFHHMTYANLGNENLDDLIPLCSSDHRRLSQEFNTTKSAGVSLKAWTWMYISLTRSELGLKPIKKSKIAQYMGEFND